tara:strand:- start:220 stop:567 length:348 start_codon:yes stop_codon:yes gene_type:complete
MTKAELELKVKELNAALTQFEIDRASLAGELDKAKASLESINKPKITKEFVEEMREAVHQAIQQISFDSVDSYEYEFEINYDNQLSLSSIEFNEVDEINESVCDYIENLFNVIED